jgi:hypothetical protein
LVRRIDASYRIAIWLRPRPFNGLESVEMNA